MALPNPSHPSASGIVLLAKASNNFYDDVAEAAPTIVGGAFATESTAYGVAAIGNGASYADFGARAEIAETGSSAASTLVLMRLMNSSSVSGAMTGKVGGSWTQRVYVSSGLQQFLGGGPNIGSAVSVPSTSFGGGISTYNGDVVAVVLTNDGTNAKLAVKNLTDSAAIVRVTNAAAGTFPNNASATYNIMAQGNGANIQSAGASVIAVVEWNVALSESAVDNILSNPSALINAADTTAPILSLPTATAVSSSTATGGVTTNEAGPAWAVLTTSATAPTAAQIKLGQDHTGAAAAASDTATLTVSANAAAFDFTGLTGGTTYYPHYVQDDTATPANTSNVVTNVTGITTPTAPKLASTTLTTDGTTAAASLTGLRWAWWDAAPPNLATAPIISGTTGTTNGSGVFTVTLTGTTLNVGQTGTLLVLTSDGTAGSTANRAYCAPVVVS